MSRKILVIIVLCLLCITFQSCTATLKRLADRKYPPRYEATIRTESAKRNFCALQSFNRADLAFSLNSTEINEALQDKMPELKATLEKMKPLAVTKKISIDSVYLNSANIYTDYQYIGLAVNTKMIFSKKSLIKNVRMEFDGGMTVSSSGNIIYLTPFVHSVKILSVKSKFFILGRPFIRNFVNKILAELKDNVNGAIPTLHYTINVPVFPDKHFSSFLSKAPNIQVISDVDLKIDYTFLPPAMIIDSNNIKIMTEVVDAPVVVEPAKCNATDIKDIEGMDEIISNNRPLINIDTKPEMAKINSLQYNTKYTSQNSAEADSIAQFQKLYAFYKYVFDTIRCTYLTPDLSSEKTASQGNISKDLIQRATTLMFSEATAFKLGYGLKGQTPIGPKEIKLLKNPDVNCTLFDYTCNLTFDCHKVLSPCNQDCRWTKPWNCAAKALCIGKNALAWSACQAVNVPARGVCLTEAVGKTAICATEIVGKFLLYKFLTVGTIDGNLNFSGNATFNLANFKMSADLSSVGLMVNYSAQANFDADIHMSNMGGLGYIACRFPPTFHDAETALSASQNYKVGATIKEKVANDIALLNITTTEDPIDIQFVGRYGKSPFINLLVQNPLQFAFNCPVLVAALALGSAAVDVFGDDQLKSYVNALYTGFYRQKLPSMNYEFQIKPIDLKSDSKEYKVYSTWTNKSIQFTLK